MAHSRMLPLNLTNITVDDDHMTGALLCLLLAVCFKGLLLPLFLLQAPIITQLGTRLDSLGELHSRSTSTHEATEVQKCTPVISS